MFRKLFLSFIVVMVYPMMAGAFQLDWSGYYKGQALYLFDKNERGAYKKYVKSWGAEGESIEKKKSKDSLYGEHSLYLSPTARIADGLEFDANFAFPRAEKGKTYGASKLKGTWKAFTDNPSGLEPTHFYGTYTSEFFRVQFGRLPFHFGLGMTYSEGFHPNEFVYDVRDAVSVEVRMDSFYVKPYLIFRENHKVAGAVMAGYKNEEFGGELLYRDVFFNKGEAPSNGVTFKNSPYLYPGTASAYAFYNFDPFSARVEWGGFLNKTQLGAMAVVGELDWQVPFYDTNAILFAGYSKDNYTMNINYGTAFMIWDNYVVYAGDTHQTSFTDCAFAALLAKTTVFENYEFSVLYNWMLKDSRQGNEAVVAFAYKTNKGFKWETKAGVLFYKFNEFPYFAGLSRAIITF